ncbi:YgiT-type zinc finger protein [Virgibacillus sp. 19R1-5]|nr:YgiT-type zinc finger protein [Virgibacillus sp. 19R1-5]
MLNIPFSFHFLFLVHNGTTTVVKNTPCTYCKRC